MNLTCIPLLCACHMKTSASLPITLHHSTSHLHLIVDHSYSPSALAFSTTPHPPAALLSLCSAGVEDVSARQGLQGNAQQCGLMLLLDRAERHSHLVRTGI